MSKPLSRAEMDTFLGTICNSFEEHPLPEEIGMVIAIWEPESVLMCALRADQDDEAGIAQVDQMLATRPRAAGAALRVMWTNDPDPAVPTLPSWVVTAVTPGRTARFAVRQDVGATWYTLTPEQAPWLVLSTAGSLRAALEQGTAMHFKRNDDPDPQLFKPPGDGPTPKVDKHGRI